MGRKKLFTTFPRRLLDDDMFIRMSSEARHLLFHLYAYLHPHGRAPMSELMLSRYFVPQLFPTWKVAMDELVKLKRRNRLFCFAHPNPPGPGW